MSKNDLITFIFDLTKSKIRFKYIILKRIYMFC